MQGKTVREILSRNEYPGRGIILGKSVDGKEIYIAYFIMGRSENSRNRVFKLQGDDVVTEAYDESKLKDPSLIIYKPVKAIDKGIIVTNGDQTETISEYLKEGKTFEEAVNSRTFEPDAPNYTPRISGMIDFRAGALRYKLSIVKALKTGDVISGVTRCIYEYEQIAVGTGHIIHTYKTNGTPLPSYDGEPKIIQIQANFEEFTRDLWGSLNSENRISLFTRRVNINNLKTETKIINKNGRKVDWRRV